MKDGLRGLIVLTIDKRELYKKRPDLFVEEDTGPIKFLKGEVKEDLAKLMLNILTKHCKQKNYYLLDEIVIQEGADKFYLFAFAWPKFVSGTWKKLRPPRITHEEFKQKVLDYIAKHDIVGVFNEADYYLIPSNVGQQIDRT